MQHTGYDAIQAAENSLVLWNAIVLEAIPAGKRLVCFEFDKLVITRERELQASV